ncbi:MAG: HU family DNA-binding protein [Gemmataceae bacterium]
MTKKEIVKQISEEMGMTQLKTKEIVQRTLNAIVETLSREGRIELRNFGVFEVKQRKARNARNPRTGDRVEVESKNVVTFKPGKEMEERVRDVKFTPKFTSTEDDLFEQVLAAETLTMIPDQLISDGVNSNITFETEMTANDEAGEAVMASVGNDLD